MLVSYFLPNHGAANATRVIEFFLVCHSVSAKPFELDRVTPERSRNDRYFLGSRIATQSAGVDAMN